MNHLSFWITLLLPNILSLIVSRLSGPTEGEWYQALQRSPLTPPSWVFGIVWPILYLLIGYTFTQLDPGNPGTIWLYLNMALNLSWIWAFNKQRNYRLSLAILIAMLITLIGFFSSNTQRELNVYLIPYFIWCIFATYLNGYITRLAAA